MFAILAGALAAQACLPIPNRVRDTPEINGQVLEAGNPIPGMELTVSPRESIESVPPSCPAGAVHMKADSLGIFQAPAHRHWNAFAAVLDAEDHHPDGDRCQEALIAAEVVAAQLGQPHADIDEDVAA